MWRARLAAHEVRVERWLAPLLQRRRSGVKHPVEDFLFTYYSYRPGQLRRWHPGHGVVLVGADPAGWGPHYVSTVGGTVVDTASLVGRRRPSVTWIRDLLVATASRPAHLGCFGMHEWAMVYRQGHSELRHEAWPLRLGAGGTAEVIEQATIRCTHFDAFRFFTPAARPLNLLQPTRDTQADNEQPGCLHANMDVYRWAYKLSPLVRSELVADCFALAREIRTLDMKASPYDLTSLGLDPVRVETAEGRAEYVRHQREFAERAAVLRGKLIDACTSVLSDPPPVGPPYWVS
jgi:hypothetical protein